VLLTDAELDFVRAEVATALGSTKAEAARDALVEAAGKGPSRLRRAVATALCQFPDDADAARALVTMLDGDDPSYYAQAAAAEALGRTRHASAFDVLTGVLGRPAHNDVITVAALTGLAHLRDVRAIDTLLAYTEWGRHQNARRAAVDALGVLGPLADDPTRLRVRERLEALLDDRWLRVQLSAVNALAALKDVRATAALGAAAARALDGRVRRTARVAIRTLTEGADKGEELRGLKDEVEKLQQENQKLKDRLTKLEAASNGANGGGRRRKGAT
jgi:aminopeptidase N